MNRDDIIRMAQEACDPDIGAPGWDNGFWSLTQEELERFAALVAAAERERETALLRQALGALDWGGGTYEKRCDAIDALKNRLGEINEPR